LNVIQNVDYILSKTKIGKLKVFEAKNFPFEQKICR